MGLTSTIMHDSTTPMPEKQIGGKTTIAFVSKQYERHTRKRKAQGEEELGVLHTGETPRETWSG